MFDDLADSGADISGHLKIGSARSLASGEQNPDLVPTRVNVDFTKRTVVELDIVAARIGVPRQALIKMWINDRLKGELPEEKIAGTRVRRKPVTR